MKKLFSILVFSIIVINCSWAGSLSETIKKVKPSVVGIGVHTPMNSPSSELHGTGFVIGNGKFIATNYHVVSKPLDVDVVQYRAVFSGSGQRPNVHRAEIVAFDPAHDLAILEIKDVLPASTLAKDSYVDDGTEIAFTGFPIGAILGLYPATHRGIIASLSPDVIPANRSEQLSVNMLDRLKKRFMIYQLDATAYPGNSGSAMYKVDSGEVIGVMNKVFVAETKESVLSKPSGISYAIPIKYLRALASSKHIDI